MVPVKKVFLTTCVKQSKTNVLTSTRVLSVLQMSYSVQGSLTASVHVHPASVVRREGP